MDDLFLSHRIASYECGADLALKPEFYLLFCQEMAELHAARNNMGYDWVVEHGMIWVEVQGDFEILRPPHRKELVRLRTNTGKASPLQARRFVEMQDAAGNIIGRADILWVVIDIRSRRPLPLKRAELTGIPDACPATIAAPLRDFPEDASHLGTAYLTASRRDVDFNGHINNSAYLTWVLDSLPCAPGHSPSRISIAYKHETFPGELLRISHSGAGRLTRHCIESGGCLRAKILLEWAAGDAPVL